MQPNKKILITIVTESSLESRLSKEFDKIGVLGYTIIDARGKGARGERNADWDADSNIQVEVICSAAMADKIWELLKEKYFEDYAMITHSHEVLVLRPDKFK